MQSRMLDVALEVPGELVGSLPLIIFSSLSSCSALEVPKELDGSLPLIVLRSLGSCLKLQLQFVLHEEFLARRRCSRNAAARTIPFHYFPSIAILPVLVHREAPKVCSCCPEDLETFASVQNMTE